MSIAIQPLLFGQGNYSYAKKNKTLDKQKSMNSKVNSLNMPNSYYNRILVQNRISFGEGSKTSSSGNELEAALARTIPILKSNDVIVIGKNLGEAKSLLKNSLNQFPALIEKFFYIKEPSIEGAIALYKSSLDIPAVLNLNAKAITVLSEDESSELKQGENKYLNLNDTIIQDGKSFQYREAQDGDNTILNKTQNISVYNIAGGDTTQILKLNTSLIERIVQSDDEIADTGKITFRDVGGQEDAIQKLKRYILYPIKHPILTKGERTSHGIILQGPPGTGKTLLAQALANESNAHFINLNGVAMQSKWVGQSEENWRKIFEEAEANQPCIIFIDEFEGVARQRSNSDVGRHDDKIVDQLLGLMSDIEKSNSQIYVVAATNMISLLDNAIIRSGRFGRHVNVKEPDLQGCKKIIDIYLKNKKTDINFDKEAFAKKLFDLKVTGSDIPEIISEAKTNAFMRLGIYEKIENNTFEDDDVLNATIAQEDFDKAIDIFKQANRANEKHKIGFAA